MDSLKAHARFVQDLRQRIVFRSCPRGFRRFVPALDDHGARCIARARTVLFNKADPGFVEQLGLPCFCFRHLAILADGVLSCKSPRVRAVGIARATPPWAEYDRPGDVGSTLGPQIPSTNWYDRFG